MQDNLIYILPILTLIIGIILTYFFIKLKFEKETSALNEKTNALINEKIEKENSISELQKNIDSIRSDKENINIELTRKVSEINNLNTKLKDQKSEVEELQEKFTKDFEILANKILEEKSEKFTAKNKENIAQILTPLQEKISSFEKKVEETHKESIDRHAALRQQILGLKDLNEQMSKEAVNLTKALKGDSKKQGDWGEYQLEILLEKSGLTKEIHYTTQGGLRDDDGNLKKPDFIINLPDNKHLIIDSKVSLTGYESYFNTENELDEKVALKKHITSIRKHYKELGEKRYSDLYGINTPDYVLMFVPIEPALMIALQEEKNIYLDALDKNVVLVSTSTLLATLTTVASIWKQEDQKRNVIEIAKESGLLYDKFEGLLQDLIKIGKSIQTSQDGYQSAMNKLSTGRGNLISKIENLKKLGAKTKKSIPENLLQRSKEK
ncbi:MAG: DNA recombination protein RmuC [Flavobacteriaceae bacterium]|nr:DNA recombination protein RmuC [Flavobacteriaceae bacterium]